jgi:hypothetical protein
MKPWALVTVISWSHPLERHWVSMHLQLTIPGMEGLVLKNGIFDMGRKEGHSSVSLRLYHDNLDSIMTILCAGA